MFDSLKKIGEKIQGTFEERVSHLFGGPYLFSWIVCNHKILMVILSSEGYANRIYTLSVLFPHTFDAYVRVFAIPFGFAALYVIISPLSEPIVKIGLALSELVWRLINGLFFKVGWYSAKEVAAIRQESSEKVLAATAERDASLDRENSLKTNIKTNLRLHEELLRKHLRSQLSEKDIGPMCLLDVGMAPEAVLKFPGEGPLVDRFFMGGVPRFFVDGVVGWFAEQQAVVFNLPPSSSNQQVERVLAYGVSNRLLEFSVMNDYSLRIRLTPFAVFVLNAVVRANPEASFVDKWNMFVNFERSFASY